MLRSREQPEQERENFKLTRKSSSDLSSNVQILRVKPEGVTEDPVDPQADSDSESGDESLAA
eukprot:1272933-Rhodomonas_salina.1